MDGEYVKHWRIMAGDCVARMRDLDACSIDAIVCDPPYGLEFMGKEWDAIGRGGSGKTRGIRHEPTLEARDDSPQHRAAVRQPAYLKRCAKCGGNSSGNWGRCKCATPDFRERSDVKFAMQEWHYVWAVEAIRVLKPGGHLLAFGGTRTYHRLTCALEDVGFEIRDCIMWVYGSGFPKSLDVSKAIDKAAGATSTADGREWQGWGTALKPAYEPIVVARRPLSGTVASNVLKHGTGALNVDGCRIDVRDAAYAKNCSGDRGHAGTREKSERGATDIRNGGGSASDGRWPANVVMDRRAGSALDAQSGTRKSGTPGFRRKPHETNSMSGRLDTLDRREVGFGDEGGASRFFYCAKVSKRERAEGLDAPHSHPTTKPVDLMRYLIRLVTPPEGVVLDPFAGSGTTGVAAMRERMRFIGIEREAEYRTVAARRLRHETDRTVRLGKRK